MSDRTSTSNLGGMAIEGNKIKCDVCGREKSIPTGAGATSSERKIEASARRLGWKSVAERDFWPNCA